MSRLTGVPLQSNNGSEVFGSGSGMGILNATPLGLGQGGQQERRGSQMESLGYRLEQIPAGKKRK